MVLNGLGTACTFSALNMPAVSGVPDRDQGLAGALLIPLRTPTAHNAPAR
jgi:hypothetical protein